MSYAADRTKWAARGEGVGGRGGVGGVDRRAPGDLTAAAAAAASAATAAATTGGSRTLVGAKAQASAGGHST